MKFVLYVVLFLLVLPTVFAAIGETICLPSNGDCFVVNDEDHKQGLKVSWSADKGGGLVDHEFWFAIHNTNWLLTQQLNLLGVVNQTVGRIAGLSIDHLEAVQKTKSLNDLFCTEQVINDLQNNTEYVLKDCAFKPNRTITIDTVEWTEISNPFQVTTQYRRSEVGRIERSLQANVRDYYRIRFKADPGRDGALMIKETSTEETYHPFFNSTYNQCLPIAIVGTALSANTTFELNLTNSNFNFSQANNSLLDLRFLQGTCNNPDTSSGELFHWLKSREPSNSNSTMIYVRAINVSPANISMYWNTTGSSMNRSNITFAGLDGDSFDYNDLSRWSITGGTFIMANGTLEGTTVNVFNGITHTPTIVNVLQGEITFLSQGDEGVDESSVFIGQTCGGSGSSPMNNGYLWNKPASATNNFRRHNTPADTNLASVTTIAANTFEVRIRMNNTASIANSHNMTHLHTQDSGEGTLNADTTNVANIMNCVAYRPYSTLSRIDYVFVYRDNPSITLSFGSTVDAVAPAADVGASPPNVTNVLVSPANGTQGTSFRINATITVNSTDRVDIARAQITPPNNTAYNLTLVNQSGREFNVSWPSTIVDEHGSYSARIIVNTSSGGVNNSVNFTFNVTDRLRPSVLGLNVTPSFLSDSGSVRIEVNVTDNIPSNARVSTVVANVTNSNGRTERVSLVNSSGNTYNSTYVNNTFAGSYVVLIIANDTSNNINSSINATYTVGTTNQTFQTRIIEQQTTGFILELNYSSASFNTSLAVLERNGTNTTATRILNASSASIITDRWEVKTKHPFLVNLTTNVSIGHVWIYTLNGTSVLTNRTVQSNQTVFKMIITTCSAASESVNLSLNFTILDFETKSAIVANISTGITVWSDAKKLGRTYGFRQENTSSNPLCIFPDFGPLNSSFELTTQRSGYSPNKISTLFTQINTTPQLQDVLLSSSARTSQRQVTVLDELGVAQQGLLVEIQHKLIQNASFELTTSKISDVVGDVFADLILSGNEYRILVKNETELLFTTETTEFLNSPITITVRRTGALLGKLKNFLLAREIGNSLTFSNSTRTVSLVYSDTQNITSSVCLRVFINNSILNTTCSTAETATIDFTIPTLDNGILHAIAVADVIGGSEFNIGQLFVSLNPQNPFGVEAPTMALLIVGTLGLLGASFGMIPALIFVIGGLMVMYLPEILIIGQSNANPLVVISVVIGIVIIAIIGRSR